MEEELLEEKLTIPADEALEKNEDLNDERTAEEDEEQEISFEDLGLDEITLAAIKRKKFEHPSPIQVLAIPRLLNGEENVVARARTGTGKTAAFGLPLVQTLREDLGHVRAIILEPTRELAMQTANEMSSFATGKFPRSLVVYGGSSYSEQIRALKKGVEIVVGTPGRVQDLIDRKALDISPEIRVCGIAGPGDTLASNNAFKTFNLVGEKFPRLIKCMSTNGLLLNERADQVIAAEIDSLTVTVNAVDPKIEAQLNDYIIWHGKKIEGEEGAKILIKNQLEGIRKIADAGITVKVTTSGSRTDNQTISFLTRRVPISRIISTSTLRSI